MFVEQPATKQDFTIKCQTDQSSNINANSNGVVSIAILYSIELSCSSCIDCKN